MSDKLAKRKQSSDGDEDSYKKSICDNWHWSEGNEVSVLRRTFKLQQEVPNTKKSKLKDKGFTIDTETYADRLF